MNDFSKTVFTPKSNLPTRFKPEVAEAKARRVWEQHPTIMLGAKDFLLVDGPPYANGDIHIGHAMNKVLKDIVARMRRQRGENVMFQPGWDCHGLPIEWAVELEYREQGLDKASVPASEFRRRCREFAQHWVDRQREGFIQLGISADWSNPYVTMDRSVEAKIMSAFHDLLRQGLVYRESKPVLWSAAEQTSMATAETEDHEQTVPTVWVKFPILSGVLAGANVLVWTTTPWSLPGNAAVVFSPSVSYGLYEWNGASYLIADARVEDALQSDYVRVADVSPRDLEGLTVQSPFRSEVSVPMFAADFVTDTTGSGFVHLGPSHSMDDWLAWKKQFGDAVYPQPVGLDGRLKQEVPMVGGLQVVRGKGYGPANEEIVSFLAALNVLHRRDDRELTLPHSWRSGALLLTLDTPQWFIDLSSFRQGHTGLSDVVFTPESGATRLQTMLTNRPDWVVSRQRMWGTPLGFFVHRETGVPLLDERVLNRAKGLVLARGSEGWWDTPVEDVLGPDYDPSQYERVDDVLDVWFDSACVHRLYGERADLVIEGSDQSRGWFQSSLIVSQLLQKQAPYKRVLTHGFVMDATGHKMSKSKKNALSPAKIVQQYGADVLRLWVASCDYSQDVRLSEETLKTCAETHRKVRNTLRYLVGPLAGFKPPTQPVRGGDIELRGWQLLCNFSERMERHVAAYDFSSYTRELHRFCVEDLSGFLFDVRKDVLYCADPKSALRLAYLTLLKAIYQVLIKMTVPLMPFTAEEVHAEMDQTYSAANLRVMALPTPFLPADWDSRWGTIMTLRDEVNAKIEIARAQGVVKTNTDALVLMPLVPDNCTLLEEVFITSGVRATEVEETTVVFAGDYGLDKCKRCWKYNDTEAGLCYRCTDVLEQS